MRYACLVNSVLDNPRMGCLMMRINLPQVFVAILASIFLTMCAPSSAECQTQTVVVLEAGVENGFSGGSEEASPNPHLASIFDATHDFDESPPVIPNGSGNVNSSVIHRFELPAGTILSATLETRVAGISGSNAISDNVAIFFDDGTTTGYGDSPWWRYLGVWVLPPQSEGLIKPTAEWTDLCDEQFSLDLAALPINPLAGGGFVSVLSEMNSFGFIDVVVNDESQVDFYRLTLTIVTEEFQRGDCNQDGVVDISDPVAVLSALFSGTPSPTCEDACDHNDDGSNDISDAVYLLDALFGGGAATPGPSLMCGADPTGDSLSCSVFAACP